MVNTPYTVDKELSVVYVHSPHEGRRGRLEPDLVSPTIY